jgi:hypothetical protein
MAGTADAPEPYPTTEGHTMLELLIPQHIDNTFRGQKAALWLFGLLALMRTFMGFNVMFNTHQVAITADGIPLDSYPAAAAQNIVAMFALLGLTYLSTALMSWVVLVRYRAAVPLMFTLMLLQFFAGSLLDKLHPLARVGEPPAGIVSFTALAILIVGWCLSLWRRKGAA